MGKYDLVEGEFDALIFDMDGTLVNTMPVHYRAWEAELAMHGMSIGLDEFNTLGGMPAVEIARMLANRFGLALDPVAVALSKEGRYMELLTEVVVIEETVNVVRTWHGRVPMAVATGSKEYIARQVLTAAGLWDYFVDVITSERYERGKPAPDPFLRAAEAMGIEPARCVVFEDSETGIQGAQAAGMKWFQVVA